MVTRELDEGIISIVFFTVVSFEGAAIYALNDPSKLFYP